MANKKILLCALWLLFISMVQAPSLTVTPGTVEPGELDRGETYEFNIYLQPRNVEGPVKISPTIQGPFFDEVFGENAGINSDRVSEEPISDWISFDQDEYLVDPENSQSYTMEDGSELTASEVIEAEIRIPDDAEPGFHAGRIGYSVGKTEDSEFSTTNWIIPVTSLKFEVPGNVERSLELQDARMLRIGENRAQIIAMIENTGTVTTSFEGAKLSILDGDGRKVGEIEASSLTLPPSGSESMQEVSMVWQDENLEPGTYEIDGTGDFITGRFYMNAQDSITQSINERVEIQNAEDNTDQNSNSGSVPTWLILMILILLAIIMYSFEIDPLWIVLIVGLMAISAFVLVTDLPIYLIGISLIVGFLLIYYGMV